MLAIRMQRTGRKGQAQFRIIVQDARRTPTSGAVVARLGYYNPHDKHTVLDKEKTDFYLEHGAQPSDKVARLLQKEGIKLPTWVKLAAEKSRTTRHPEKLRKNQPDTPAAETPKEIETAEPVTDTEAEPVATAESSEAEAEPADSQSETAVEAESADDTEKKE